MDIHLNEFLMNRIEKVVFTISAKGENFTQCEEMQELL